LNSKESTSKSKIRLLVDTSFLLPAMGIETEKEVMEAIKHFHIAEIHYLEVSILEAMWKIIKVIPADKLDRVKEGIEAIMETYKRVTPQPEAYIDAYKLYLEGHRDYIDNLIYATSQRLHLPLLTVDREFINFLKEKGYSTRNIVTPNKVKWAKTAFDPRRRGFHPKRRRDRDKGSY